MTNQAKFNAMVNMMEIVRICAYDVNKVTTKHVMLRQVLNRMNRVVKSFEDTNGDVDRYAV